MPNGIFKDFNEQTASRKAEKLKRENPDQPIFIIYDYEVQRHDAITKSELHDLYMIEWHFTILYQV
jgi:hypothetical protein